MILLDRLWDCGHRCTDCGDCAKTRGVPGQRRLGLPPPPSWDAPSTGASVDLLQERASMILGMNPKHLRERRRWLLFLWKKRLRWALVVQPSGSPFTIRVVDDFLYDAQEWVGTMELASEALHLVFELLDNVPTERGDPVVLLSVKPDFRREHPRVKDLGFSEAYTFDELVEYAALAAEGYQNFATAEGAGLAFITELVEGIGQQFPSPRKEIRLSHLTQEEHQLLQSMAALGSDVVALSTQTTPAVDEQKARSAEDEKERRRRQEGDVRREVVTAALRWDGKASLAVPVSPYGSVRSCRSQCSSPARGCPTGVRCATGASGRMMAGLAGPAGPT